MAQVTKQDYINKYTKQQIEELLEDNSQSKVAKIIGCGREMIKSIMDHHGIPSTYIKNTHITAEDIIEQLHNRKSMIQIAHNYNCEICTLNHKLRKIKSLDKPKIQFTKEEIFDSIKLCDVNNQGFTKVISVGDSNLGDSIFKLTKNHITTSDKITERLYRLQNEYAADYVPCCKFCDAPLKFYTYELGYGSSEHNTCKKCTSNLSGVSIPSQKLFWEIYNAFDKNLECYFSQLNREWLIEITPVDRILLQSHPQYKSLNTNYYVMDFVYGDKIIEYGWDFYRKSTDNNIIKNVFLKHKHYKVLDVGDKEYKQHPEETLQKCIDFINSP